EQHRSRSSSGNGCAGKRFADGEFDGLHPQRNAFQKRLERDEKARSRTDFRHSGRHTPVGVLTGSLVVLQKRAAEAADAIAKGKGVRLTFLPLPFDEQFVTLDIGAIQIGRPSSALSPKCFQGASSASSSGPPRCWGKDGMPRASIP